MMNPLVPSFTPEVIACAAFFTIAALSIARGRREPLAVRLAVVCVVLFAYTAFDLIGSFVPNQPAWDWLDAASAALAPAACFHFVFTFLGRRSDHRRVIAVAWLHGAALALASLAPVVTPLALGFPNGPRWALLLLGGLVPEAIYGIGLLIRHVRLASDDERSRTVIVLGCMVIAALGTTTDLVVMSTGEKAPGIASMALAVSAILLAFAAFRARAFERVSVRVAANTIVLAVLVVLGELTLFWGVGSRAALFAVGTAILGLFVLLSGRFLFGAASAAKERAVADAMLGRMSRQMAHDLRNPLAAIRGAAQYLQGERAAGRPLEDAAEYLDLVVSQADRMERVIDQYQRLGRIAPRPGAVPVGAMLERARTAFPETQLAATDALGTVQVDEELVVMALENLLRNAWEATGHGAVTLAAAREGDGVRVVVEDDGPGMDPRTREQAFDEFFTTKTTGSGLGLSFVKRVAEAHGGRVALEPRRPRGLRAELWLPDTS